MLSINWPRRRGFSIALLLFAWSSPAAAGAQTLVAARRHATADSDSVSRAISLRPQLPDREPLFSHEDAWMAAGFAAATVALFPLDKRLSHELRDSSAQANRFFKNASKGVELIASPGAYVIGGGLYIAGRLAHEPKLADLGWHGSEAVLLAQGITFVLKGSAGRSRPFVSSDTNPRDFSFGRGFGDGNHSSFPSGHTSTAFAAASAVTAEASRWWPRSTWVVGPVMYVGATAVGLSRMYHDRHWATDVALGAAIGTFSGRKVVQYAHTHPTNRLDRLMLRTSVVPTANGAVVAITLPAP